jgi:hypothetical protein
MRYDPIWLLAYLVVFILVVLILLKVLNHV